LQYTRARYSTSRRLQSGLFSATVAAALVLTFPDLKPDPQDQTNFYLANIYQLLASSNGSHITVPTTLPDPPAFSPPASAISVNLLWFLSLFISLTCALFAILLQQWARLYLTTYHTRHTLLKEARIRELLAEGVNGFQLPFFANVLRSLHHLSFFLFLAGLLVLLFNTHHTVFVVVSYWISVSIILYIYISNWPIFFDNCPYSTPLTPLIWYSTYFPLAVFVPKFISRLSRLGFHFSSWKRLEEVYCKRLDFGMIGVAEETAETRSQELDGSALLWTFKTLSEDQELERFIAGIPSFCSSKAIENPLTCLASLANNGLTQALFSLMHRTLTSTLVSESTKQRRICTCAKALDAAPVLVSWPTLCRVFGEWDGLLGSLDFGRSVVRIIGNSGDDPSTEFCSQCIVSVVITRSQEDGGWSDLATALLGISDDTLLKYNIGGRNNVLLATLVFTIRQSVRFLFLSDHHSWDALFHASSRTLDELVLNTDVQHASSELQQDFCAVWNELVHTARDSAEVHRQSAATEILRRVRKCYIALHENTDPSIPIAFYEAANDHDSVLSLGTAYPLCDVESDHPILLPPDPHSSEGTADGDATETVTQCTSSIPTAIIHAAPPV
jgi:hypothetical protein